MTAPRPAPSAEARRLIEAATVAARTRENVDAVFALYDHVAKLEAEVGELRKLASGAVFHFFCCGPGAYTEEDECGQFVPAMADLAKAIGFDADPSTKAEIAAVPQSQATTRRNALAAQEKHHVD